MPWYHVEGEGGRWRIVRKDGRIVSVYPTKQAAENRAYMLNLAMTDSAPKRSRRQRDPERKIPPKPVICIETGRVFDSLRIAAKWAGLSSGTAIKFACKSGSLTAGYHWRLVGQEPVELKPARSKPIRCIETGEVFRTQRELSAHLKVPTGSISWAIKKGKKVHNYTFRYV